ncbi:MULTISPECIES: hypothetical protein [unclassified Geodermatophilus]|uniref:hypothetical protein n=1 Tax=unclassified Geodermatophilus TaxID=2637632 RepID=UPI003EEDD49F
MFESMTRFTDMTGQIDRIRRASSTLLRQGDRAEAAALVSVLQDVGGTFTAVELVLKRFLSLRFEAKREDDATTLIELQGGEPAKLIGEMRARSSKIGHLYWDSLRGWFARSGISDQERRDLETLFEAIGNSDNDVIKPAVREIIDWLQVNADSVAESVRKGEFKKAKEQVDTAGQEVAPIRRAMGKVAADLLDLEIQFTPLSFGRHE